MDEHKHRALLHFLKRSEKPLQLYVEALAQLVQELEDAYDQLESGSCVARQHQCILEDDGS